MELDLRCQVSKSAAYDPTGENAVECNAPAEYCGVCDMNVCGACHTEITGNAIPHERKPVAAVGGNVAEPVVRRMKG
jgi:hypothetical protein